MNACSLLTAAARRHIRLLARDLLPAADRIERRFRAELRARRYDALHAHAILAITPVAAARARTLPVFLESAGYYGCRLARLNVAIEEARELLEEFNRIAGEFLQGRHAPAREQLHLVTAFVLQDAWYRVREGEARVFYGLAHAEAEAISLDGMLSRVVRVLAAAFSARGGRLLLLDRPPKGRLTGEYYGVQPLEDWPGYASYWSFPAGNLALIQLAFDKPYPWLPRERTMMEAVAARCAAAIERARMNTEIVRLHAEAGRAEEEERRRLGRELHDDTAQSLLVLRLQLEMMERDASPPWRARLSRSRKIAEQAILDLRRTIAALSPAVIERLGLIPALRQLAARFEKRHPAKVKLAIAARANALSAGAREVVYRVVQEALQNIAKHSRATRVNIRLSSADMSFRLSVSDNGAGFDPESALGKPLSFGLAGMRDRAALLGGTLAVRSVPGKGATVTLQLPRAAATEGTNVEDSYSVNRRSHAIPSGNPHPAGRRA
ncbi:MAG: sensor histidine kinase [Acidobacteriota bacterium]|nr:sensor histidine kinase [Acidobacteriota bacterium]